MPIPPTFIVISLECIFSKESYFYHGKPPGKLLSIDYRVRNPFHVDLGFLDKTLLVCGSWWWDPWIGTQPNLSWVHKWDIWLRSNEENSWIKMLPLTGFCFYLVMFLLNIFPLKLFIFIWNTMDYFFIAKLAVASSQQVKCSILLPKWCHSKHPLWCYNG